MYIQVLKESLVHKLTFADMKNFWVSIILSLWLP